MTLAPSPRSFAFSFSFVALVLVASACSFKFKPGQACQKGTAACLDPKTSLVCQDEKFVAAACHGANGCQTANGAVTCDVSGNVAGDPCAAKDEGAGSCSADGKSMIMCRDGGDTTTRCGGKNGCTSDAGRIRCDESVAAVGDGCSLDKGSDACTEDGSAQLTCVDGKFVSKALCRGPKHCHFEGTTVHCDLSVGEIGESCAGAGNACNLDNSQLLKCTDGKLALDHVCRGGGCVVSPTNIVGCTDMSLATVGDRCLGTAAFCAMDHKHTLKCEGGHIVQEKACTCEEVNGFIKCASGH